MGCIHGKSLLSEEDIAYIARNTAMSRSSVEVIKCWRKLNLSISRFNFVFQSQYKSFLTKHPDGKISRKSFHTMMEECYPGMDSEKLERHIFRMYDANNVGRWKFSWNWELIVNDISGRPHRLQRIYDCPLYHVKWKSRRELEANFQSLWYQ